MAYTTIDDPEEYFNSVIFTGDGTDDRAITVGFQPDLVWCRQRTDASGGYVTDSVRGNNAALQTTNTNGEGTFASMTFTSTGITVSGNENLNNEDAHNYVFWNWKAGGSASTNENGTFDSSVSVNTDAGFSVCTFTVSGSGNVSFGHGLNAKPKVVITKSTSHVTNWNVYNENTSTSPENDYLFLNTTAAKASATDIWGDGMTTSTVGLGVGIGVSAGRTYVAYCFAEKQGYSKFGSYTGNGNADGTFVYTGFKPAWILIKRSSTAGNDWGIFDNKRLGYNVDNEELRASSTDAEQTDDRLDILSNGFKIRLAGAGFNASGDTFIYMAFAENPFVSSSGVPACAR